MKTVVVFLRENVFRFAWLYAKTSDSGFSFRVRSSLTVTRQERAGKGEGREEAEERGGRRGEGQ